MTTEIPIEAAVENMPEGDTPDKKEEEVAIQVDNPVEPVEIKGEVKTDTIVTQQDQTPKDDCSDLTDNNGDGEEQIPRSFPQKLMDILSEEGQAEIISWLPHGNGFIIHKKKTFANDILPRYFKASKFTSFTRKLNRWGFSRVPRGPETGAYFHKLFRRDKSTLCMQMTSNSGNKYQNNPLQQHLLPNVPGGMMQGGMPGVGYPFMPGMMPQGNLTPQQQQAMWQQQMQHMMQMQQMHMMQMQQQQRGQQQQQPSTPQQPLMQQGAAPFQGGEGPTGTPEDVKLFPTGTPEDVKLFPTGTPEDVKLEDIKLEDIKQDQPETTEEEQVANAPIEEAKVEVPVLPVPTAVDEV